MTKLTATVGSLAVVAVGVVLVVVLPSSVAGLVVMVAGLLSLAAVLIRSVGGSGRRDRPRRTADVPQHDPDRAYFDALREMPPDAGVRPRPGADRR